MTFEDRLRQTANAIDIALDRHIGAQNDMAPRLIDAMRHGALGAGKRLRPFLLIEAAHLCGLKRDIPLNAAASLECVHCYSLIHDDLPALDDDDLRRGRPTVHVAFDEATAVLAGDALLTLGFEILGVPDTHEDAKIRIELVTALARAAGGAGMIAGQIRDMEAETKTIDLAGTIALQKLKTGALIEYACWAGATLAKAPVDDTTALVAYASDIGLAFQIADDLLDAEATSSQAGKRTGKDDIAGKATFVAILGLEGARAKAEDLISSAIDHLARFGPRADILRQTARFITSRKS
jgi:farnesyl diphosphate synthase